MLRCFKSVLWDNLKERRTNVTFRLNLATEAIHPRTFTVS